MGTRWTYSAARRESPANAPALISTIMLSAKILRHKRQDFKSFNNYVCVRACACLCVYLHVRACACLCVYLRVRACVRVSVCVCMFYTYNIFKFFNSWNVLFPSCVSLFRPRSLHPRRRRNPVRGMP